MSELAEEVGGIDILVNNAAYVVNKPHEEFSIEEYEDEVRINSSAAFVLSRACSKHMKQKKYGKIVNLTSLDADRTLGRLRPLCRVERGHVWACQVDGA